MTSIEAESGLVRDGRTTVYGKPRHSRTSIKRAQLLGAVNPAQQTN